ncbi:MAG: diguanylate cyclase/phosphodiesterase [Methylophaga sp.]|nr:MAG: diguanylate cyclase/phosphodiesterase [Methylophaga sp.]
MYNTWSIKHLLQLWSIVTIVAIILIASLAIYSNEFFATTQKDLTQHILPIENASRQINGLIASFIARQEKMMTSASLDSLNQLDSRKQLEVHFDKNWQQITASVKDSERGIPITGSLHQYYKQFLEIDDQLLELTKYHHRMQIRMEEQGVSAEKLGQQIQNHVEFISGRINLQLSRMKRRARLLKLNEPNLGGDDDDREDNQYSVQKLSHALGLNTLKITSLAQKIRQANNTDSLVSIRGNDIQRYESILNLNIEQLRRQVPGQAELVDMTKILENEIKTLLAIVVKDQDSIYQLRHQQLKNNQLLAVGQKKSISVLEVVMAKLEQLSILVRDKSLKAVTRSAQVAETTRWAILLLSLMIAMGMFAFIRTMSKSINASLTDVRSAMRALSSKKFDTRLEVSAGNNEFAVLAEDFNKFANNNQLLIEDLAKANDDIQSREQHISTILSGVPEVILTLSSNGEIQSSNPAAERVLKANNKALVGLKLMRFFAKGQSIFTLADLQRRLQNSHEFEGVDYNNQPFSMWLSLNSISSEKENLWVCVISDITAWKRAEENLKTTSSELDAILENAMVGIALIKNRIVTRVNTKFEDIFRCDRTAIVGHSSRKLYPTEEIYRTLGDEGHKVLSQGENYVSEIRLLRQDGNLFWGMMSGKAIDASDPHAATIWLFEDITDQRDKDEKLLKLASIDSLTGLPNRSVFNDRLEHAIHQSHRKSVRLAVFFLDLDRFKHINDSLGHKAGDILLCEVANRLKQCVRDSDTVARLGGDEFTLILEDILSIQYVAKIADKVLNVISQTYIIDDTEISISPSIGISLYPADGQSADALLRNADAAMYHAKESGRNNFQFYSSEMNSQAAERLAMQTSLRRAVDQNEFYLNFQPQINLKTGRISGAEALLRWNSSEWGQVSPVQFIPILEDTGLINDVGKMVLRKACEAYLELKDVLEPDFKMAVNLSGRQFNGGQLASIVKNLLEELGMPAKHLELEITENILMGDTNLAVATLMELSDLGISLAIDDFGTGYSSLSYLKQFPLDVLKIDRSFVRDINDDADDAAIVDAILAMSRRLNLEVVAEGVETLDQLAFLQAHDCPRVQGYYFSRPLSFDDFRTFVEKGLGDTLPKREKT